MFTKTNGNMPSMSGEPLVQGSKALPDTTEQRSSDSPAMMSESPDDIDWLPSLSSAWPGLQTCLNASIETSNKVNKLEHPKTTSRSVGKSEITKKVKKHNPSSKENQHECEYCDKKYSVIKPFDTI